MSDNDPPPDVCHDGDWLLYGWMLVVLAVGVPRALWRRVRRAVSHALYEASCIVDPESRPAPDLPERAAARWRASCQQNGRQTQNDGP